MLRSVDRPALPARFSCVLALLVALTALPACEAPGPGGLVVDGGGALDLQVDVAPDSTVYDWDGRAARSLEVENRDDGEVVWRIAAGSDVGFAPPVVHGEVPAGADEEVEAALLVTGAPHEVTLVVLDGTTHTEPFTP